MKLIFIRHGDPDYSNDTLTPRGWKEAEVLSKRVSHWKVDNFYCSPLGRAQDTANLTLKLMNRTAETKEWLREFFVRITDPSTGNDRIPWDLMPSYWTRQSDLYDKDNWHRTEIMKTGKVSEEYEFVRKGIDELLADHGYIRENDIYKAEKPNTKTLVFFCHLGVQFVILSHLFGISAPAIWQNFFVAPTSVTVLETEEREEGIAIFRCKCLGDVSHLYMAGITPSDSGFFNETF